MNILCIMHADFEKPGVIESWAKSHQHTFHVAKPYLGEDCLTHQAFDLLIVLGGPQSPLEMDKAPYLKDEIVLIQKAIADNKIVLGFCLGAQLIGEALGAKTEKSPNKEVGVFPIFFNKEGLKDPLFKDFSRRLEVIHWHNDMPGETKDSTLLAFSEGCPRQIIRYGTKIYGFQCHLEITKEGIEEMVHACPDDLKATPFTQPKKDLMMQDYDKINGAMFTILDRLSAIT